MTHSDFRYVIPVSGMRSVFISIFVIGFDFTEDFASKATSIWHPGLGPVIIQTITLKKPASTNNTITSKPLREGKKLYKVQVPVLIAAFFWYLLFFLDEKGKLSFYSNKSLRLLLRTYRWFLFYFLITVQPQYLHRRYQYPYFFILTISGSVIFWHYRLITRGFVSFVRDPMSSSKFCHQLQASI